MAGTIVRSLDHKGTTSGANAVQEQFTILFGFLEAMATAGHMTRIALQWGNGGTGTDFHDGANPFGENAFAVYTWGVGAGVARAILIQWATTDAFGAAPGAPGRLNGGTGDGVGLAMAVRPDGTSPWAGTTNNDGTDTKGTPVWTPGSSTLHVIDRACSTIAPGGSFATNRENLLRVTKGAPNGMRMHCVGDADTIAVLSSEDDLGGYSCFTCGRYVERAGIVGAAPLYAIAHYPSSDQMWADGTSTAYGSTNGLGNIREGGVMGRLAGDDVSDLNMEVIFTSLLSNVMQPNQQIAPQELDGVPPSLFFGNAVRRGLVGRAEGEVLHVVFSTNNHGVSPSSDRAYMCIAATDTRRWSIPWDGGAAPGVGVTRAGRLS